MKIIKLISENVKGLKAVEIIPDEHFQIISGRNEQGKSSVLDSIFYALGGKKALEGTDKPIREGEDHALIEIDLGDIVVTRKFRGDGTTLEVKTKDGAKYSSPQTMLDQLIGRLSFDPLAFCNLEESKQRRTLQELIGFDPDVLDLKRQKAYDQRSAINREISTLTGQLAGVPEPSKETSEMEISASAILQELKAAQELQKLHDQRRRLFQARLDEAGIIETSVSDLKEKIAKMQILLTDKETEYKELSAENLIWAEEIVQLIDPDIDSFQQRMEEVETVNQQVRSKQKYNEIVQQLKDKNQISVDFSERIAEIDAEKEAALRDAKFPIEGLGFGEDGLIFKGIPLKQCSAAGRLKVSLSMAMALNPKVRVIRIQDGSLLDADNLAVIEEMAKDQDYQVWCEIVDNSGTMGIYIEDGQIKVPVGK